MIIDGKKLAGEILNDVAIARRKIKKPIVLAAVLVGSDPGSIHFLRQKERACRQIGVKFVLHKFPANIKAEELSKKIKNLAGSKNVQGIILQLPLPNRFKEPQLFLDLIPAKKDVDVLGAEALGRFISDKNAEVLPPVIGSIKYILDTKKVKIRGKKVVIIGSGKLVGKPAAIWFMNQGATVSVINSKTKNPKKFTKTADIMVTGVGKPGFIKGNILKKGVIVFDAGYTIKNGRVSGDCDFVSVSKIARFITPVPGGIGPMTVAILLKNLIALTA